MTPKEVLERAVFAGCCEHGIDDMLQHSEWDDLSPESRGMYSDIADACLRALRAAGLVVVPREPTPEMQRAMLGFPADWILHGEQSLTAIQDYRAMLAAAEGE